MPIILVHSPKGGTGTTFLAAQLALHVAASGHDVAAYDTTFQDSLKLHFGFKPTHALGEWRNDHTDRQTASGVSLTQAQKFSHSPAFGEALANDIDDVFNPKWVNIIDVGSEDRALVDMLRPYCTLHICPLLPSAASLAALSRVSENIAALNLARTVFVLNQLDDRQRLSRHSHTFMRDLFGDQLLTTVRRDEAVNEALARFEPIAKFTSSSVALPDLRRFATLIEERLGLREPAETSPQMAGEA